MKSYNGKAVPYELTDEGVRIVNGPSVFNRPLYGTNAPGMLHAGDKPFLAFDLHYTGGKVGNALFAVLGRKSGKWLHDARQIEFTYIPGRCRYVISDPALGPGKLKIDVVPLDCGEGFLLRLDAGALKSPRELLFFFGGGSGMFLFSYGGGKNKFARPRMYGKIDTFDPGLNFEAKDCEKNTVTLHENGFALVTAPTPNLAAQQRTDALKDPSPGPKTILGAARVSGRWSVGDGRKFRKGPQALIDSQASPRPVALFRWNTQDAPLQHIVVNAGPDADAGKLAALGDKLFVRCAKHFDDLSRTAEIATPNPHLDMSFRAHVIALDAAYESPLILHGAQAWRAQYLGWRNCHGFDAIGWHDRARSHLLAHAEGQLDIPYQGGLLPSTYEGEGSGYEMSQVFLDMLLYNYEWTGDLKMMESLLSRLRRILEAERSLYGHDNSFLYTNRLNFNISDAHWFYGGPCPEASAYLYRAYRGLVRVLKKLGKPYSAYEERMQGIRRAMNEVLWLPAKGHFAQYKDVVGLKRLHEAAALTAIYHPVELELTDMFQSYQQLRYVETHLECRRWGEGLAYWNSNWMPAYWDGRCYHFFSNRCLYVPENSNLALAYYRARQPEDGYRLLQGNVFASYRGPYPLGMGYSNPQGEARHDVDGSDTTSPYLRVVVEGLFGVRANLPDGEIVLEPNFPEDWNHASLRTPDISLGYKKEKNRIALEVQTTKKLRKRVRFAVRAARVLTVKVNGKAAKWRAEPGIGCSLLEVRSKSEHKTAVVIETSGKAPAITGPARLAPGDEFSTTIARGVFLECHDPQGILVSPQLDKKSLRARMAADTPGHHSFFLLVQRGDLSLWLPVNVEIKDTAPPVRSFVRPGEKTRQQPVDLSSFHTHSVNSVFQETYAGPRALNDVGLQRSDGLPSHVVRTIPKWSLRKEHSVRWTVDETEFRAGLAGKTRFTTQEGVRFRVSPKETQAAFISRWDSFDPRLVVPLDRRGVRTVYLLTAGTTEVMQTHIENVRLLARYTEGDEVVLDLVNPSNYDDSIGTFGFQHTSRVPAVWLSRNAHLDVYALRTDPGRVLASLEAEVLSQGIIFGVVAITLETARNAGTHGR